MSESDPRVEEFIKRYGGATIEQLGEVLCPVQIPIASLDRNIAKIKGTSVWAAAFDIKIEESWEHLMFPGHTGKFVPAAYVTGDGVWREIAKGRIVTVDLKQAVAKGEVYAGAGNSRTDLEAALGELSSDDFLEIDQYGASAKILSALVENALTLRARAEGFEVVRMPEDVARHIGGYYRYDFQLRAPDSSTRRVEVKSLWGTDTRRARLISSKTKTNPTSSPRFDAQDIFAVSLFLRTGNINDFAFARSVPRSATHPHGLPRASEYPDHVNQNPECAVGDGSWFGTISEVWHLA